jgi:hypothetical protein
MLHNADQIEKLDIRIDDVCFVEKGGEIIPKIIAVDLSKRPVDTEPTKYITQCPECQTELVKSRRSKPLLSQLLWLSTADYREDPAFYFEESNGYRRTWRRNGSFAFQ